MKCKDVRKNIQPLIMGELDRAKSAQVLQHIESCAECASEKIAYERLIADLSTPRLMVNMPAGLDELHIPDEQPRRLPVLRLAMVPLGVILIVMILLISSNQTQSVRKPLAVPVRQRVVQTDVVQKEHPVVSKPTPAPSLKTYTPRKVSIVRKRYFCKNRVVKQYPLKHEILKKQPTLDPQMQVSKPDVNQPVPDQEVVAQASDAKPNMDLDVTDHSTGQTYVERHIADGAVCSLLID